MKSFLPLFLFLLFAVTLFAQPANDNCADAITIVAGTPISFSTIDATTDGPFHPAATTPCPSTSNDTLWNDVWYVFTPDFTGLADWTLCGTVNYDSKIAVYNPGSACPPLDGDLYVCNDDGTGCTAAESRLLFNVTAGETYLLRLGGWGETAPGEMGSGSFTISEFVTAVPNDFCAQAIPISLGMDQPCTNVGATTDGPSHLFDPAGCFGFNDNSVQADVWYSFTAPSSTTVEWSTCDQVGFDSRLAIYKAGVACTPQDGDLLACNDDGAGCGNYTSRVIFDVVQGETYLMRLGGFGGDSGTGTFDLFETTPPIPPGNDLCVNADSAWISSQEDFEAFTNPIIGTTINGTFDAPNFIYPPCIGNVNGGEFATVWYWFNTYGNETVDIYLVKEDNSQNAAYLLDMFEACGTPVDTNIIKGSCMDLDEYTFLDFTTVTNLPTEPTVYWIRVSTRLTSELPGDFYMFIVGEVTTGTNEAFPGQVKLFPNPASTQLHLNLALDETTNTDIRIINTLGQTIRYEEKGRLAAGFHQFDFDLGIMPSGVYFVVLESEKGKKTMKFIRE